MTDCTEFFYPSCDGKTNIHAVMWKPTMPPHAILQISHGICEYVERYSGFARYLNENGILVVGNDHLGHGRSWQDPDREGLFGEQDGWRLVVDDVEELRARTREEYPDLPYFLLGHSMGSFIARTYLIRYPGRVDGALICGTGQQDEGLLKLGCAVTGLVEKLRGPYYRSAFVRDLMFRGYNAAFKPHRTDYDWVCGRREVVDAYCQDRGCQFLPTVSLYHNMLEGIRFISDPANLAKMDVHTPVFLFSGQLDPVGEQGKGVERAYQGFVRAGCEDVRIKLYPNGRHEVLNEDFREEVYGDVLQWIEVHIAGASMEL